MKRDGGLSSLFQKHLPMAHWQGIETGGTGRGIPDLNYCLDGQEGWIELKSTAAWAVKIEPGQVAWIERRARAGGRVFVAVRRKSPPGPRKGPGGDELWLLDHRAARELATPGVGLNDFPRSLVLELSFGGPARWDWDRVKDVLTGEMRW